MVSLFLVSWTSDELHVLSCDVFIIRNITRRPFLSSVLLHILSLICVLSYTLIDSGVGVLRRHMSNFKAFFNFWWISWLTRCRSFNEKNCVFQFGNCCEYHHYPMQFIRFIFYSDCLLFQHYGPLNMFVRLFISRSSRTPTRHIYSWVSYTE